MAQDSKGKDKKLAFTASTGPQVPPGVGRKPAASSEADTDYRSSANPHFLAGKRREATVEYEPNKPFEQTVVSDRLLDKLTGQVVEVLVSPDSPEEKEKAQG